MACLEHNNRPPCNKPHSGLIPVNPKGRLWTKIKNLDTSNYNIVEHTSYKSSQVSKVELI